MTYQTELQRLMEAKASMRQSIINKGVEVPEDVMIEDLPEYIAQISGIEPPTGNGVLSDLKQALNYGNAETLYPVGTEINDTWNNVYNPWIVMHYKNEGSSSSTKLRVYLLRKFVDTNAVSAYGNYQEYSNSAMNNYLNSTYLERCSEDFKSLAQATTLTIYNFSTNSFENISAKVFLPSIIEVGGTSSNTNPDDELWEYYAQKLQGSSPTNESVDWRIAYGTDGQVSSNSLWLRTGESRGNAYAINGGNGSIISRAKSSTYTFLPATSLVSDNEGGN